MNPRCNTIRLLVTPEDELLVKRTARLVYAQHKGGGDFHMEEELYHYGLIGLLEAKKNFQKSRGIPFQPFAVHRIRGAMIDHLRLAPVIRLPQKKQELKKQLEQARRDLDLKKIDVTDAALATQLGWTMEEIHRVQALQTNVVSLATPDTAKQKNAGVLAERELPARNPGPEVNVLKKELAGIVQTCLQRIKSARNRLILIGRILHEKKLRELAENLGCSMESVRLRQQKAMESMKRCLEEHGWDQQSMTDLKR